MRHLHLQNVYMDRKLAALLLVLLVLQGCASTTAGGKQNVHHGMTLQEVQKLLGTPDDRSFREDNEALQYYDVVGFGQCEYLAAWFSKGVLHAVTTRRGSSVAGCGLGSQPVDWGQMPKPSLDVNLNVQSK